MRPKNTKITTVNLALTDSEREALDKYLADSGLSKTGFVRNVVISELEKKRYIKANQE